jgi:hypothetical protein
VTLYAVWTEISGDCAQVSMSDASGKPGSTVTISINLKNNPGIAYMQLEIAYDENLQLNSVTNQEIMKGTFITSKELTTNPQVLLWTNAQNSEGDGEIAVLTFTVLESAPDGQYSITVQCNEAFNEAMEDVPVQTSGSIVKVKKHIPGDVNDDGKVNGKDSILLAQYLARWDVSINLNAADVNGDGKVNGKDSILLAQYLAKWDVVLK